MSRQIGEQIDQLGRQLVRPTRLSLSLCRSIFMAIAILIMEQKTEIKIFKRERRKERERGREWANTICDLQLQSQIELWKLFLL